LQSCVKLLGGYLDDILVIRKTKVIGKTKYGLLNGTHLRKDLYVGY